MSKRAFQGRKALVTGAAAGIGRAIAVELARFGCDLYLLDVDTAGLDELLVDLREHGVCVVAERCDLSRPEEISHTLRTMLHRWGPIDVLVNNAGIAFYGPTETMTADQWNRLLAINLHAPIQITRELLPTLMDRPNVYVLNVCSIAGLVGGPRAVAYQTSKFGLVGFTEAIRAEYGRRGMNVTAACPGTVATRLYETADCGREDGTVPTPPSFVTTTPEHVARVALRGVARNKPRVVVTAMAHALNVCRRFVPGLLDFAQQFGRWKKLRKYRREERARTATARRDESPAPSKRRAA